MKLTIPSVLGSGALSLAVLLVLGATAHVAAQAGDADASRAASARSLFEEGVGLADQSQWANAADRFRRALALRNSPVIAYNLASALQELGQLVEASEMLRKIEANPETEAELRKSAQTTFAQIEPRIARMKLHVEGGQPGDVIALDDRPLLDAQLDVAVPIDPGSHVVTAKRGQQTLTTQRLAVAEGASVEQTLRLTRAPAPQEVAAAAPLPAPRAAPAAPAAAPAARPVEAEPERGTALTSRWPFWVGIGAVVVGAVVVTTLVASGGSSNKAMPAAGDFNPPVLHVEVAR
jgi:hypothetical protein